MNPSSDHNKSHLFSVWSLLYNLKRSAQRSVNQSLINTDWITVEVIISASSGSSFSVSQLYKLWFCYSVSEWLISIINRLIIRGGFQLHLISSFVTLWPFFNLFTQSNWNNNKNLNWTLCDTKRNGKIVRKNMKIWSALTFSFFLSLFESVRGSDGTSLLGGPPACEQHSAFQR